MATMFIGAFLSMIILGIIVLGLYEWGIRSDKITDEDIKKMKVPFSSTTSNMKARKPFPKDPPAAPPQASQSKPKESLRDFF